MPDQDPIENANTDEFAVPAEAGGTAAASEGALLELQRAVDEQRDKYLRLAAEYDNFRKRAAKERLDAGARGQADLVTGLLDSLDDLGRVAHVDAAGTDARSVLDGVAMVERKLLKVLGTFGLEAVAAQDMPFDPNLHEAVTTEPAASEGLDQTVGRVFQPGYIYNGQLLRPARVVVRQWNG